MGLDRGHAQGECSLHRHPGSEWVMFTQPPIYRSGTMMNGSHGGLGWEGVTMSRWKLIKYLFHASVAEKCRWKKYRIRVCFIFIYPTSITIRYVGTFKVNVRNNNKCNYIWTEYDIINIYFIPYIQYRLLVVKSKVTDPSKGPQYL